MWTLVTSGQVASITLRPRPCWLAHRRRNAVRGVDHALAIRNFVDLMHEDRALFRQLVHNKAVMHDLPAHIDGRAKGVEGDLDNVDGAHHAGAKAARLEQQNTLLAGGLIGAAKVGIVYVKIKVLREQGKELARVVIPSQSDPNTRRDLATMQLPYQSTSMQLALPSQVTGTGLFITDFKARTTHPDGTVVPLEGKLENLLKIETSQQHTRQTVVYLPGVEVGSIVEYRYAERYDGFYTSPQWDIQRNYFVHKAHFSFLPYKSFRSGTENATGSYLMDRHGAPLNFLLYWPQLPPGAELKRDTIGRFFLDVTDVPAAPEDDWMPPSSSLLYRVRFYYKGNSDAKGFWVKEARQWSKEVDRLAEPTKAIQDAVQGLVTHNDSDLDKARKLYKAVQELQNTDFTNKQENAAAKPETQNGKRAEDTWTQKSGSSQDIALLYLAMLRAAGLTAYDMKVVNRDRGTFAPDYLYLGQLDDDIILVMIGGKETVLDPGQKMCPFQMVHWKHTGAGGIREGADSRPSVTSPLQPYTTNTVLRMGEIKVDEHGAAVGSFRFVMAGQEALYWRQESLRSAEADLSKEFDQWLESNTPQGSEAHLDRFEGLDNPEANLVAILRVKASGWLQSSGWHAAGWPPSPPRRSACAPLLRRACGHPAAEPASWCAPVFALFDEEMLVGKGSDLRQMRHAQHLLRAAQHLQLLPDRLRRAAADADVDLIEDQRSRRDQRLLPARWLAAPSSTLTFSASITRLISPPEAISSSGFSGSPALVAMRYSTCPSHARSMPTPKTAAITATSKRTFIARSLICRLGQLASLPAALALAVRVFAAVSKYCRAVPVSLRTQLLQNLVAVLNLRQLLAASSPNAITSATCCAVLALEPVQNSQTIFDLSQPLRRSIDASA
jgi:hypothetical protein